MVSKPTGLFDKLPSEAYTTREIKGRLQSCMESFGYRLVETPVIEYGELFLRKSGEELASRMFAFEQHGRSLCLRPEFTASVGRLFVEHLQHLPKPIRLYVAGPVFRYESPRRGSRSRQFTMVGAELIGASGGVADAEIVALACEGLEQVGVLDYRVVLGHIGVIVELLKQLGLDMRALRFIISHMEGLRKPHRGRAYVNEQLQKLYLRSAERVSVLREKYAAFCSRQQELTGIPPDIEQQLDFLVKMMFDSVETVATPSRKKEEIAERLLLKLRRADEATLMARALDFVEQLGQVAGHPAQAFQEVRQLIGSFEIDETLLDDFQDMVELLVHAYGIPESQLIIDMGLGRGLHYYTGMVFEIHSSSAQTDTQFCGGGRYDELLRILGSNQETPAVGFAYGLERVVQEIESKRKTSPESNEVDVLVIPVSRQEMGYAVEIAQNMRRNLALKIELDVKVNKSVGSSIGYANKRRIPYVMIAGSEEMHRRTVTLRKMREREQLCVAFDELVPVMTNLLRRVDDSWAAE